MDLTDSVPAIAEGSQRGQSQAFVRMYRHGLGDCFLLRFPKDAGGFFTVLIDCGLIAVAKNPTEPMARVVADISNACGPQLDLVIMTHEHWDHVSGFSKEQMQEQFKKIAIKEVWYAWTENPDNKLGARLRRERESKLAALKKSARALLKSNKTLAVRQGQHITSILGFFGVKDQTDMAATEAPGKKGKTREAFDYLGERRGVKKRYCKPSDAPISFTGVSCVRAYILGPPEDEQMLKRSRPTKKGQEVYDFSADIAVDESLGAAFERMAAAQDATAVRHDKDSVREDKDCPFDSSMARRVNGSGPPPSKVLRNLIDTEWQPPEHHWRRIEDDWTAAAETLALNLDAHTNNTCLVVAFELLPSGEVLLFPADAQVGSWLSWQQTRWRIKESGRSRLVTGPDLLERVVFYKVGHHGSHNATLRALGLEQMASEELVAFLPVNREQACKSGWTKMPFGPLVERLREKTAGRLVVSDTGQDAPTAADLSDLTDEQRAAFAARLQAEPGRLYYEISFDTSGSEGRNVGRET